MVKATPHARILNWLDQLAEARTWRDRADCREALTPELLKAIEAAKSPALDLAVWRLFEHNFDSFEPRPDNPAIGDEQTGYYESDSFITVALGGNGCLGGEQPIYDPVANCWRRVDSIRTPFGVRTLNPSTGWQEVTTASVPWVKGVAPLYRWTFSNGKSIVATDEHRVVDAAGGWVTLRNAIDGRRALLCHGESRCERSLPATNSDAGQSVHLSGARHSSHTTRGYRDRYSPCLYPYGEPLHPALVFGQSSLPLPAGAREHSHTCSHEGALAVAPAHSRIYQRSALHSTSRFARPSHLWAAWQSQHACRPCLQFSGWADSTCQADAASRIVPGRWIDAGKALPASGLLLHTTAALDQAAKDRAFSSSHPEKFEGIEGCESLYITGCEYLRTGPYYDLETPPYANYEIHGLIHANSGKSYLAAQRLAEFVRKTPPPTRDTPFWIIGDTYEQVCRTCWHEKLREIIPEDWIDYDRITWYSKNRGWPQSVPLKRFHPDRDHNWIIEFKSYEQGRSAMQAAAIGGAWFTEQQPWDIFQEVLRGCREWALPGSVWLEFTPVDPAKSVEISQKYEDWQADPHARANKAWSFYHLNTEAALRAGHVEQTWFDAFVGSVSDEMYETRIRGAFATYEGAIYPGFRPAIHCVDGLGDPPPNVFFKRSIDWGASEEHAFVCLFGYRDALGTWYIFDEYYSTDQNKTALDHAAAIMEMHDWPAGNPHYRQTYGDPSRPDLMRLFAREGLPVNSAKNDVMEGIEAVRRGLKIKAITNQPGIIIDREKCPWLVRQLSTYRWEKSAGRGVNPRDAKPQPLKKDDHAPDALRYLIYTDLKESVDSIRPLRVQSRERKHLQFKQSPRGRRR